MSTVSEQCFSFLSNRLHNFIKPHFRRFEKLFLLFFIQLSPSHRISKHVHRDDEHCVRPCERNDPRRLTAFLINLLRQQAGFRRMFQSPL